MGGNSDGDIEVTDEERNVMKECVKEAFWYRSLPASTLTGKLLLISFGCEMSFYRIQCQLCNQDRKYQKLQIWRLANHPWSQ